jgi:hypothetical protein
MSDVTKNGLGCLSCLSLFICPIPSTNGERNESVGYKHDPKLPTNKVGMIDRYVAEHDQIKADITKHAQSTIELKQQLHWLVVTCKARPDDNRCVSICDQISVHKKKMQISNERYMEVKLFVDHQRHKQTMERRRHISTVMKRDKPLYALIQKEHDTFMDNVNEMDDFNSQMEDDYAGRHPASESIEIDMSSMVQSYVSEVESHSMHADSEFSVQVTHENTVPKQQQDTLCINGMQPKYARPVEVNEGGNEAEMEDFSLLEASIVQ